MAMNVVVGVRSEDQLSAERSLSCFSGRKSMYGRDQLLMAVISYRVRVKTL